MSESPGKNFKEKSPGTGKEEEKEIFYTSIFTGKKEKIAKNDLRGNCRSVGEFQKFNRIGLF